MQLGSANHRQESAKTGDESDSPRRSVAHCRHCPKLPNPLQGQSDNTRALFAVSCSRLSEWCRWAAVAVGLGLWKDPIVMRANARENLLLVTAEFPEKFQRRSAG